MAMTKRELIQFMDELVELASEENKTRAILVKEKFISDFEKSYEYGGSDRGFLSAAILYSSYAG